MHNYRPICNVECFIIVKALSLFNSIKQTNLLLDTVIKVKIIKSKNVNTASNLMI